MQVRSGASENPKVLSGWKDIANYLGKGVRTVQRYERELGLPVRRPAGRESGSVIATKAEVDAWVSAIPLRNQFQFAKVAPRISTHDIRTGIEQMLELRQQMFELRLELRSSLLALGKRIQEMQHWSSDAGALERFNESYSKFTAVSQRCAQLGDDQNGRDLLQSMEAPRELPKSKENPSLGWLKAS